MKTKALALLIVATLLLSGVPAWAQVSAGASGESHTGTTASTSAGSFQITSFNMGASPQGVIVCVHSLTSIAKGLGVAFDGGPSLAEVSGGTAVSDTAGGEDTATQAYFLSNPPTGTQTLTITRTNDATSVYASIFVFEAATTNTEVYTAGVVLVQNTTTAAIAEQNVDDGSPGTNSLRIACGTSSADSPDDAGANSSNTNASIDIGGQTAKLVFETTAGQGSRAIGFGDATTATRSVVHLAVREVATAATHRTSSLLGVAN